MSPHCIMVQSALQLITPVALVAFLSLLLPSKWRLLKAVSEHHLLTPLLGFSFQHFRHVVVNMREPLSFPLPANYSDYQVLILLMSCSPVSRPAESMPASTEDSAWCSFTTTDESQQEKSRNELMIKSVPAATEMQLWHSAAFLVFQ